tara:strand:+ start:8295 stop:8708 length:414 start_codon:yes stop_codon:yes gene_type:complete
MSFEEDLRSDLQRDEGLKLKPYLCPAGKLSLGYGRNLDDVGITQDEAMAMLDNDIDRVNAQLAKALPWLETKSPDVQRAIANMTFQMGIGALLKFKKMLAALQARDYNAARREALDSAWAKQTPQRAKRVTDLFKEA